MEFAAPLTCNLSAKTPQWTTQEMPYTSLLMLAPSELKGSRVSDRLTEEELLLDSSPPAQPAAPAQLSNASTITKQKHNSNYSSLVKGPTPSGSDMLTVGNAILFGEAMLENEILDVPKKLNSDLLAKNRDQAEVSHLHDFMCGPIFFSLILFFLQLPTFSVSSFSPPSPPHRPFLAVARLKRLLPHAASPFTQREHEENGGHLVLLLHVVVLGRRWRRRVDPASLALRGGSAGRRPSSVGQLRR
ncbi:hypothetical protein Cni_G13078 [Canna indica]|uniref:Uncharacterized protein n=1 Tax=Canna indica TaxID=4628 RepID=A0AAQ3K8Y3_9LILI|nr:hypothetical protein Cni_G13078 [Canna indica]